MGKGTRKALSSGAMLSFICPGSGMNGTFVGVSEDHQRDTALVKDPIRSRRSERIDVSSHFVGKQIHGEKIDLQSV